MYGSLTLLRTTHKLLGDTYLFCCTLLLFLLFRARHCRGSNGLRTHCTQQHKVAHHLQEKFTLVSLLVEACNHCLCNYRRYYNRMVDPIQLKKLKFCILTMWKVATHIIRVNPILVYQQSTENKMAKSLAERLLSASRGTTGKIRRNFPAKIPGKNSWQKFLAKFLAKNSWQNSWQDSWQNQWADEDIKVHCI